MHGSAHIEWPLSLAAGAPDFNSSSQPPHPRNKRFFSFCPLEGTRNHKLDVQCCAPWRSSFPKLSGVEVKGFQSQRDPQSQPRAWQVSCVPRAGCQWWGQAASGPPDSPNLTLQWIQSQPVRHAQSPSVHPSLCPTARKSVSKRALTSTAIPSHFCLCDLGQVT